VNDLLIGLVGAVLATNQPQAVSNLVQQQTGISMAVADVNDPVERELQQLMADDDDATAEVDKWIRDNNDFFKQGAGLPKEELNKRILERFASVRKNYEDFLRRHPDSAHGYLAYGSFLNDIGEEESAVDQYEKSRQVDPKNPAVWNNLANYYGEHGPLTNAFIDYAKAIELNPAEPIYYQNMATTVYLYRRDAREYYHINEQQVFDKALTLYQQAMKLDPENFPLATDYAQTYYGIRPLRTNDALVAWTNALNIARDDVEREGVYLHLARIKTSIGQYDESRALLDSVTNGALIDMKKRLQRSLHDHQFPPTNSVPKISTNRVAVATNPPPVLMNGVPALTNPPVFSPKVPTVMSNVPPIAPKPNYLGTPPSPENGQNHKGLDKIGFVPGRLGS
jgi:tetratricopeptide (TPR) repeat protein